MKKRKRTHLLKKAEKFITVDVLKGERSGEEQARQETSETYQSHLMC